MEGNDGLRIALSKRTGFCYGVRRAVGIAEEAGSKGRAFTIGPLVHNPLVVEKLREKGVAPVAGLDEIKEGILIVPSHGLPPDLLKEAERRGLEVVHATCPNVGRTQRLVADLKRDGYQVFIVGDDGHSEVAGLVGFAGGDARVVRSAEDVLSGPVRPRVGVVCQTTQTIEAFRQVLAALALRAKELVAYNTICNATEERQQAARELARSVDAMIVVGGRASANTRRLAEICEAEGAKVYWIEAVPDVDSLDLSGVRSVGIAAGASTPNWVIEEVMERMSVLGEDKKNEREEPMVAQGDEKGPRTGGCEGEDGCCQGRDCCTGGGEGEAALGGEQRAQNAPDDASAAPESSRAMSGAAEEPNGPAGSAGAATESGTESAPHASRPAREQSGGEARGEGEPRGTSRETAHADGEQMPEGSEISEGDIVRGTVVAVHPDEVLVNIGLKSEGVVPRSEISRRPVQSCLEVVREGQEIDVLVERLEDKEGRPRLSKRKADTERAWETVQRALDSGEILEGEVTDVVKGGVVVDVGLRGFVPASHASRRPMADLSPLVGQTLRMKVLEADRAKRNVVLSARLVQEQEAAEAKARVLDSLQEGEIVDGIVRRVVNFGAFVDIGEGVEGLLHVSDMAWTRTTDPRDVVHEGDHIRVKVLSVDRERERISLGLKQTLQDPWEDITSRYPVGSIVTGKVTKLADFGAFVELEPGIEGLIHISQLAERRVSRPDEVVKPGDEVSVKVISVRPRDHRIGLSLREAQAEGDRQAFKKYADKEEESGPTLGDVFGDLLKNSREE
ncbi:MAG: bifunctional 4-hydroxy-3-methylbut-2-enyl diphosphate reductase/30S ribosomal protein S1 [Firmicutes bacterium]|jgi:4-hydroxy-3-methylbut-2-enyl diphosphate reductase|nr:bifunctional 4-hydroxy-3-methylbut-2-enyl diphosphate reductase/30S ribosomal protein S1 [Bacillota bacterium]MDH7495554.1 bifunctional 4-hydroxy-3-methylbut-2-enyl diphosphate reductase/30S ribosomal protein S1 [Bacillota bacterium]